MEALIIIDMQMAFLQPKWGKRNNPFAEQNMLKLMAHFRQQNKPVIHIHHISTDAASPFYVKEGQVPLPNFEPQTGEAVFYKNVNSGFIGTNLEQHLRENKITDVVIVGLTLPHCISTTTRMASNLGFQVTLIEDATASFPLKMPNGGEIIADEIHRINLATLNGEFATILSTDNYLAK